MLNGCYFTPSTRAQSSEQEYRYLAASKRHPSTPDSRNTPKAFPEEPSHILSRGRQNVYMSLACSRDFSQFFWRVKICSIVLRPRRKPHRVSSSFGSIIFPSWHTHFLGGIAKRCRDSWFIHSSLPICVWGRSIC